MEVAVDTAGRLGIAGTTGSSSTESSSSGAAGGGGDGAVAVAEKRKQVGGGEEKEASMEGAGTTTIAEMPDEILLKVLSLLFGMTLMRSAPQVCKRWRKLCPEIKNVHLDFSWWGEKDEWGRFNGKKVPLEVLAGWLQKMQTPSIVDGGGGAASGRERTIDQRHVRSVSLHNIRHNWGMSREQRMRT